MARTKEGLFGKLIEQQISEQNLDVYDERLRAKPPVAGYDKEPGCIYFYYIRIDNSGMVRADEYFYTNGPRDTPASWDPIPYDDVTDPAGIVRTLALNGRPGGKKDLRTGFPISNDKEPKRKGTAFENMNWDYPSYIVFFFDEKNWSFHKRGENRGAVVFNVTESPQETGPRFPPNRSFFDAKDVEIEMPVRQRRGRNGRPGADEGPVKTDVRTAIVFVNHHKGSDDLPLGHAGRTELTYKFDMYLKARFTSRNAPAVTVIFDPITTGRGP